MTVRVGLMVAAPNDGAPGSTRRWIASAEDAGLDHVSVGDHVSFYVGFGMDGLLRSAQYLGASDRIGVNTGVYLLPLRHPVLVARQLSDLSTMGPGRFVFGVGVGGEDPHEVQICGVDPRTRGRRMDECMTIVRELLNGQPIDFDGEFFQLERAQIVPAPNRPIPIVVGGRSDAAIRRAGRLGDGWFGIWVSPRRYGEVITQMEAHAADADQSSSRPTSTPVAA
jgi:alkanesulfonate monooxygenase SsuD/methylene tetrahydromethanopterin reductase-like flavin-dependent oxidoreductase (luciferase family)